MSENKGGKNMPRKPTVKTDNLEENVSAKVKNTSKKSSATSTSKAVSEKATKKATSTTAKKDTKKIATTKKTTTKTSTVKKTSTTKKAATTKKSKTTKKVTTTKTTTTKTTKSRKTTKEILPEEITASTDLTKKIEILEYYDLPYRYNQTVVKVLAQTPTTLFIYWDISDDDRNRFVEQYGEDFFNNTKPVLVIHC